MKRSFYAILIATLMVGLAAGGARAGKMPLDLDPKSGDAWPDEIPEFDNPEPPEARLVLPQIDRWQPNGITLPDEGVPVVALATRQLV